MCFPLSMTNSMILEKCLNFNNVNGFNAVLGETTNEKEEDDFVKMIVVLIIIGLLVCAGVVFYYNYHVSIVN